MSNKQKWATVGAIWLIAISLFIHCLKKDRYFMQRDGTMLYLLDKFTGDIYITSIKGQMGRDEDWIRFRPTNKYRNWQKHIEAKYTVGEP